MFNLINRLLKLKNKIVFNKINNSVKPCVWLMLEGINILAGSGCIIKKGSERICLSIYPIKSRLPGTPNVIKNFRNNREAEAI